MLIVCGKCGSKFEGKDAVEKLKAHGCDIHKYPELKKGG